MPVTNMHAAGAVATLVLEKNIILELLVKKNWSLASSELKNELCKNVGL